MMKLDQSSHGKIKRDGVEFANATNVLMKRQALWLGYWKEG